MPFQPFSYVTRGSAPAPSVPAPPAPEAAAPPAPETKAPRGAPAWVVRRSGGVPSGMPRADWERLLESDLPDDLRAELRRLRGARRPAEMRAAIAAAPEPLRELRARVEKFSEERMRALRAGWAAGVSAADQKINLFSVLAQGFELLVADFERDLPDVERRQAEQLASFKGRLETLLSEREALAERLRARRDMLAAFVAEVQSYEVVEKQILGVRAQLRNLEIGEDEVGVDFTAPLTPSLNAYTPRGEQTLGLAEGNLVRGLRIPGIAGRDEPAPEWLYPPQ